MSSLRLLGVRGGLAIAGLGATLVVLTAFGPNGDPAAIHFFAAASTTEAARAVAREFERRGGSRVVVTVASSSVLARQIDRGAPADAFLSANERWMDYLGRRGRLARGSRRDLLRNRLVLVAPYTSKLRLSIHPRFQLADALRGARLAVGDPAHVPAGIYAREALRRLGVWSRVRDRTARAANVRAALALVERGEVPAGIVYASDARATWKVRLVDTFPASSHPPIRYPVALVAGRDTPSAHSFLRFLASAQAGRIFQDHGFEVPPDKGSSAR